MRVFRVCSAVGLPVSVVRMLIVMLTVRLLAPTVGPSVLSYGSQRRRPRGFAPAHEALSGDCVVRFVVEVVEAERGRRTGVAQAW